MFVGIDNGVSGGISALDDQGEIVLREPMPICKEFGRRRVDAFELDAILSSWEAGKLFVAYERPTGSKSATAASSMADSFAVVDTLLRVRGIRRQAITPQKWQKYFWSSTRDTKAEALRVAVGLWPDERWLATQRSRKPHDGMIDAALIAYWLKVKG